MCFKYKPHNDVNNYAYFKIYASNNKCCLSILTL